MPLALAALVIARVIGAVTATAVEAVPDPSLRGLAALTHLHLEANRIAVLPPSLGRLLRIGGRTVQVLDVERLLPATLLAGLVAPTPASTGNQSASY